jgi:hypothetical protein
MTSIEISERKRKTPTLHMNSLQYTAPTVATRPAPELSRGRGDNFDELTGTRRSFIAQPLLLYVCTADNKFF